MLRAAELFFRPQRMTLHEGSLIAADEETIAGKSATPGLAAGVHARHSGRRPRSTSSTTTMPIIISQHSDQFHMALDLTAGRRGLAALGEVIERWVKHLLASRSTVEPLTELRDVNLTWYVGLDADGTRIGDALWNGEELDEAAQQRVVGLFRLTFRDPGAALDKVRASRCILILAMDEDKVLRIKPQNLLTGLPIRHLEAVT